MKRNVCCSAIAALLIMVCSACASADTKSDTSRFPDALHGVWEADVPSCSLPGNLDSDTRIEIRADRLMDYEQWNAPESVVQLSTRPLAWKVGSRLHIDEDVIDQEEIYLLSGDDRGTLTVVDSKRAMTYARCR